MTAQVDSPAEVEADSEVIHTRIFTVDLEAQLRESEEEVRLSHFFFCFFLCMSTALTTRNHVAVYLKCPISHVITPLCVQFMGSENKRPCVVQRDLLSVWSDRRRLHGSVGRVEVERSVPGGCWW